jgi:hypothetical protein
VATRATLWALRIIWSHAEGSKVVLYHPAVPLLLVLLLLQLLLLLHAPLLGASVCL